MNESTLDLVGVINIDAKIWSGARHLKKTDLFKVKLDDLPPDAMATMGSMKVFDPAALNIFNAIKRRAERACQTHGIKFLGGFALPNDRLATAADEIKKLMDEFNTERTKFLDEYENGMDKWASSFPEWETIIRRNAVPRSIVENRLSFDFQVFHITSSNMDKGGVERVTGGLGRQLLKEIAQDARQLLENSYIGKDRVTHKAVNPIWDLQEKIDGLSFVSPLALPISRRIKATMDQMPKKGGIDGTLLDAAIGLLYILSSEERMADLATTTPPDQNWVAPGQVDIFSNPVEALSDETPDETPAVTPTHVPPKQQQEQSPAPSAWF